MNVGSWGRKVHPGGLMLSWHILALFHHVPPPSSPPLKSETALPTHNFWIFLNISLAGKILGFSYDQRGIALVEKPGIEFGQYLSEFLAWPRTGKSRRSSSNQWTFSEYMNILFINYPVWRQHFAPRNLTRMKQTFLGKFPCQSESHSTKRTLMLDILTPCANCMLGSPADKRNGGAWLLVEVRGGKNLGEALDGTKLESYTYIYINCINCKCGYDIVISKSSK